MADHLTPRRFKQFVTRRFHLGRYLRHPGDGRRRPQIPAHALLWALVIGQVLREVSFAAIEALVRSPARRVLEVSRAFSDDALGYERGSARLKSLKQRLLKTGMLTQRQLSAQLGVSRSTLVRWRLKGRIRARICNDQGQWLYWPPEQAPAPTAPAADPMITSVAGGAA